MGKRGRSQKKDNRNPKRRTRDKDVLPEDMDDEIDAFHKQRDVIPLDMNGDAGESDEDNEQPVFDVENFSDDEDEDDDVDDDTQLTGLAAKIARQQKFLRAKIGGVEDEMHEEEEEDEEEKKTVWGRRKSDYYSADNVDYELQSSDEELPAEEEAEVMRLQREKAKFLSMEDFGIEDANQDESDGEPTMEEIMVKGKTTSKSLADEEAKDDTGTAYEEVKKDLNALSKEEQMDVVYSSAPELVGLLSELNDALEQLEGKVNPLLAKVKGQNTKEGTRYLEVKQILLLAYCQAITFYLLLKSEGQPVRDHPVIARLVEIKSLLDKMKQLDENLPADLEEFLDKSHGAETKEMLVREAAKLASDSFAKEHELAQKQEIVMHKKAAKSVDEMRESKEGKSKRQNDQVGLQRMEMLKVRAALEDKLKQKGVFSSITPKPDRAQKRLQPVNRQLETLDDFDDDAMDVEGRTGGLTNGQAGSLPSSKLSHLVSANMKKPKIVSGDDDLPKRDDIGERRRKHELRVLAGAGIEPMDDDEDGICTVDVDKDANMDDNDSGTEESEDEFYKQVKQLRAAKLAAKEEIYSSRTSAAQTSAEPEILEDGKRQISYQMEKNKGLTRARKKLTKNPRKKYKLKHQKAVVRRKGQVREIRKATGPYGGEATGINVGITRSIRFKG
ncbi:protein THALLO isoform X1 [Vitis vinifera]|uniref:protein THALLO isoform X1 n=1 Tax=Vitis vinifera TaxID=29760 RepID=UPI00053FA45F|nr:protein THALLO isoform X1 [Vitis vinifera]|eukprot:XP_010650700.1 PREDICTED: something about silencing protein 10 isoform X1 [Vitis vinifera]